MESRGTDFYNAGKTAAKRSMILNLISTQRGQTLSPNNELNPSTPNASELTTTFREVLAFLPGAAIRLRFTMTRQGSCNQLRLASRAGIQLRLAPFHKL